MKTSYTDQLAEWIKEKKSTPRNKNLSAFIAVRADIKTALDAGYPVKTIWENMRDLKRIEFGYDTFLNYVNRQLRRTQENMSAQPVTQDSAEISIERKAQKPDDASPKTTKITKPGTLPGFTYNPNPNIEELF